MADKNTGVRRELCEKNPKVVLINCNNHNLHLAGAEAVNTDVA